MSSTNLATSSFPTAFFLDHIPETAQHEIQMPVHYSKCMVSITKATDRSSSGYTKKELKSRKSQQKAKFESHCKSPVIPHVYNKKQQAVNPTIAKLLIGSGEGGMQSNITSIPKERDAASRETLGSKTNSRQTNNTKHIEVCIKEREDF